MPQLIETVAKAGVAVGADVFCAANQSKKENRDEFNFRKRITGIK